MAQKLLNSAQVGAFTQHVGAESMTQCVGMYVRRESAGHSDLFYDPRYAARRQGPAALVDKKPLCVFLRFAKDFLSRHAIDAQGLFRRAFERDITLFFAFPPDQDDSVGFVDVSQFDPYKFRIAQATAV
jgi:hypothetical protein